MKKFICLLLLFLFAGTVGCEPQHYLIVGIHVIPVELYFSDNYYGESVPNYRNVDKFEDEIIFRIDHEAEYIADVINLNSGSYCYAFQPPDPVADNRLLKESFSIIFDRPFTYMEDIIEAGTDILQISAIEKEIDIDVEKGQIYASLGKYIKFSDTFLQNASFDSEPYTVTFSCRTSDDLFLQTDATVKFPSEVVEE